MYLNAPKKCYFPSNLLSFYFAEHVAERILVLISHHQSLHIKRDLGRLRRLNVAGNLDRRSCPLSEIESAIIIDKLCDLGAYRHRNQ